MTTKKHLPFMVEGDQYLNAARGGTRRPAIFTAEILYNLLGLAIEKHIMAALIFKGTLADNHTFTDLIDATRQVGEIDAAIASQLRKFESYQNICPVFAGYHRAELPAGAIPEMIATAEAVQAWAERMIAA
ncbi:MAG: hypothetical protein K9M54_02025 [Kiritimatiellales bacterium]|nr:hypothetical protein [Kiritimatiellales bacterium]